MNRWIEAKDLPEGEKVYLKKDFMGWRVVEPPTKWYHWVFGSKRNIITLAILLLILSFMMYSYSHDVKAIQNDYKNISENPVLWCNKVITNPSEYIHSRINLTVINKTS